MNILGIAVKVPAVVIFPRPTDVIAIVKEVYGRATLRGKDGIESPPGEELGVSGLASWLIGGGEGKAIADIEIGIAALCSDIVTILDARAAIRAAIVDRMCSRITGYEEQPVDTLLF